MGFTRRFSYTAEILLSLLLFFLITLAGLLWLNISNSPQYVLRSALAKAGNSLQAEQVTVSGGQIYVTSPTGETYGAKVTALRQPDGGMAATLDTGSTVFGSSLYLSSGAGKGVLQIRGVEKITQSFVVGGSSQDSALNMFLQEHKDRIGNRVYNLQGVGYADLLKAMGLDDVSAVDISTRGEGNKTFGSSFKQYPFLSIVGYARGEIILKDPTYQYELEVDGQKLTQFLQANNASLAPWMANISAIRLWVNQKSHTIEQLQFEYEKNEWAYSIRARLQWGGAQARPLEILPPSNTSVDELLSLFKSNYKLDSSAGGSPQ